MRWLWLREVTCEIAHLDVLDVDDGDGLGGLVVVAKNLVSWASKTIINCMINRRQYRVIVYMAGWFRRW